MRRLKLAYYLTILALLLAAPAHASYVPVTVEEADGSPSVKGTKKIVVSNGALSASGTTATVTVGGAPGGSTTQVQFNDGGAFNGEAEMVYDKTNDRLELSKAGVGVRGLFRNSTAGSAAALGAGSSFSYLQFDDDKDFMIASQTDPTASPTASESLLYITGGVTDRIGIGPGNAGPVTTLDVLGDISATNSGTASGLRLYEPSGSGSNYSRFITQAQAADLTYTLPNAHSSGVLTNNGSGTLTWAASSGTIGGSLSNRGNNYAARSTESTTNTVEDSYLRLDDSGTAYVMTSALTGGAYIQLGPGASNIVKGWGDSRIVVGSQSGVIWLGDVAGNIHTTVFNTAGVGGNQTQMRPTSGNDFYIEQQSSSNNGTVFFQTIGTGTLSINVEGNATLAGTLKLTPAASAPGSPTSGDIYVDSTASPDELCFYDGSAWQGISSGTDANCA